MNQPDFNEEALLWKQSGAFVFGIDEAGRGCLAGPVCAAVSAWPLDSHLGSVGTPLVRDSKQMTESQREAAFPVVGDRTLASGVGFASAQEVDRWNVLRANYLAVARAMENALREMCELRLVSLKTIVDSNFHFLTDGTHPLLSRASVFVDAPEYQAEFVHLRELFKNKIKEKCIVKGDSKVYSIASASVLAKVSRDHHMHRLDKEFPAYEFAVHKGYSTAKHVAHLHRVGPCSEHRRSFNPVAEAAARFGMA